MSREFRDLKTLAEAREILWQALPERVRVGRWRGRPVEISEAVGLCLAEPVRAPMDLPPFGRSTVDGYAVRAADTFGASEGLPAYLTVIGEVRMGEAPGITLSHQQAARIPTGGFLPAGADAAVMVEQTQPWGENSIEVLRPVAPGENVVHRGDDVKEGALLLPAGHRLRPQDISALAGVGMTTVLVHQARVAVLSTGDELIAHTEQITPGKVYDMNRPALLAAVRELGGQAADLGIIPDDPRELQAAMGRAVADADVVIASGGTSVGAEDIMPEIINALGPPGVLVHGLSVRPGKPVVIGMAGEVPIFGLPGHPVSALVIFRELVSPLLRGAVAEPAPPATVRARLARNIPSQAGREDLVRVRLEQREGEWQAVPLLAPSALISSLVQADGLVRVPAAAEGLYAGEMVEVEWPGQPCWPPPRPFRA
jgi:molybdopterin molybdotransferase